MDFGALGDKLKSESGGLNISPVDALKQFISDSGIDLSAVDLKSLAGNPAVKNALIQAIEKIALSKVSGSLDQNAINSKLSIVADAIMQKAPDADTSKTEVISQLQGAIQSKLGM